MSYYYDEDDDYQVTKKKNDNHIKKVVTGVFIYWILFVIVTWITFWVKGSIPDTLVQVGLGGGGFELICTTVIEVAKKVTNK